MYSQESWECYQLLSAPSFQALSHNPPGITSVLDTRNFQTTDEGSFSGPCQTLLLQVPPPHCPIMLKEALFSNTGSAETQTARQGCLRNFVRTSYNSEPWVQACSGNGECLDNDSICFPIFKKYTFQTKGLFCIIFLTLR